MKTFGPNTRGSHFATLLVAAPLCLALGPTVRRGSRFAKATNHYGLLRTIEDAWALPRLGLSRTATPVGRIWRR